FLGHGRARPVGSVVGGPTRRAGASGLCRRWLVLATRGGGARDAGPPAVGPHLGPTGGRRCGAQRHEELPVRRDPVGAAPGRPQRWAVLEPAGLRGGVGRGAATPRRDRPVPYGVHGARSAYPTRVVDGRFLPDPVPRRRGAGRGRTAGASGPGADSD